MDITQIANIADGVMAIASVALTSFIVPLLKTKVGAAKLDNWVSLGKQAVAAAEQIADLNSNDKMKSYVTAFLKKAGVPASKIEVVHEAAVLALKGAKSAEQTLDSIQTMIDADSYDDVQPVVVQPAVDVSGAEHVDDAAEVQESDAKPDLQAALSVISDALKANEVTA